ncbi:hypothetical protein C8R43DRAFT_1141089 [Mycena crocata]|nr:hypothetical protein C8R43DRAFT_1141089 [Mycena crocata]
MSGSQQRHGRSSRNVDIVFGVAGGNTASSRIAGDRAILISDDGARRAEHLVNITHKKARFCLDPDLIADTLGNWDAMPDPGVISITPAMDRISSVPTDLRSARKRKDYTSSDEPMSEFSAVQQLYLEETMRIHGLGYETNHQKCALCKASVGVQAAAEMRRFFRCTQCGVFHQCLICCLERHALSPLHMVEEWKGEYWRAVSLRDIGLLYQLGHEGFPCPVPDPQIRSMTLVDVCGIHEIHYRFCNSCAMPGTPATKTDPGTCATYAVLDLFRLLNVVGNVNANDFITSLERLTCATVSTGMEWMPDTYKAFLRMTRQWAFIQRTRRAARAYDTGGIKATKAGELLPDCWPCPHPKKNLPVDWREVDPKHAYMYRLLLALDANFKLKNRIRANERDDPSLGPGWGAFVEPNSYKEHLVNYVAEKDISTCIAFAALTQKETRNTAGLRVSGVGGCVCARHECMRPNGLGDLQKGERYANMDFILMSALADVDFKELTVSYDIACQWKINFAARMQKLPEKLRRNFDDVLVQSGLPVWHALAHESGCMNENTLSLLPGVGKSDGEGIERLWAALDGCAFQTKEMGLGNRVDTLEDRLDSHNYLKNLGQGDSLRQKLIVAYAERQRQIDCFKEINKTVSPEVRSDWQKMLDDFEKDHKKPNPYVLSKKDGPSEAEIRLQLKKDEQAAADQGTAPLHATSATAFLTGGLQLEESQRRIKAEIAAGGLTADRKGKIEEHRLAFTSKLRTFRSLQQVYTPGAARNMAAEDERREGDAPAPLAEHVRLWMPSELPADGCHGNLPGMEAKLRLAQCTDALSAIRTRLHAKRHLIAFRDENVRGQVRSTRARSLIDQVGSRVDALFHKYVDARKALTSLKGATFAPHLRILEKSHLILEGEDSQDNSDAARSDRAARKKLGRIGAGKAGRPLRVAASTSGRAFSWIWTAAGVMDDAEADQHESVRVEWVRAKCRKTRWEEEVILLREEMRRVIRYLDWDKAQWEKRAKDSKDRLDLGLTTRDGLQAYALKQAALRESLGIHFRAELGLHVEQAVALTDALARNVRPVEPVVSPEGDPTAPAALVQ